MNTLGQRVAAVIETKGLKRSRIPGMGGPSRPTLYRIENDPTYKPEEHTVDRLADVLGVNRAWLRTGEGPMLPPPFKNDAELEAYITGAAPGPGVAKTPKVYDPAYGAGAFPALLTKAITAALSQIPTPTPEAAAKAAVEATITAQRTQKEDRIEDLVKILLS